MRANVDKLSYGPRRIRYCLFVGRIASGEAAQSLALHDHF